MKTYRSPQSVITEIRQLIAKDKPSPHPPSLLVRVLKLLCEARNYERAAIFLVIGGREVPRAVSGTERADSGDQTELKVPIKIAARTLGSLRAVPASGHQGSGEERVLLREVADLLALYLTGKGRYLVRKAREALLGSQAQGEARGYQPASEKSAIESRRAAAGEKFR